MTFDNYFTVGFDFGKVVLFTGAAGSIRRVTFDLDGRFEERPSFSRKARDLAAYLGGREGTPAFKVDLSGESPFRARVYRTVMRIPYGRTATYGQVAFAAGSPGGARAVGQAMAANRYPLIIPCHRVVSGRGKLGGFSSGPDLKRYLLRLEGIEY